MPTKPRGLWSVITGSRFSDEKLSSRPSQLPGGMDRICMLIPSLRPGEVAEGQGHELGLSHLPWERGLRGK